MGDDCLMEANEIAFHRNGVTGKAFNVGLVQTDVEGIDKTMLIIQFDQEHTAVFDFEKLKKGVIAFGENSWRGDVYAESFEKLVKDVAL